MKASRYTAAHQSITFSRRMMLVGGAQAAFGAGLIARLGYLSIAQNEGHIWGKKENIDYQFWTDILFWKETLLR